LEKLFGPEYAKWSEQIRLRDSHQINPAAPSHKIYIAPFSSCVQLISSPNSLKFVAQTPREAQGVYDERYMKREMSSTNN
jgi:hypothetical protein